MRYRFFLPITILTLLLTSFIAHSSGVAAINSHVQLYRVHHRLFPVTITDDLGTKTTIPREPKRLVSLDPRDTETLFALGLENRIVADGGSLVEGAHCCKTTFQYPQQWPSPWGRDYPSKAKLLPHVEGGYDIAHPFDLEFIIKEKPDLIFTLNSLSQLGIYQKMRRLGLKVIVLDPHNFKGIEHDITLVGRATGAVKQAAVVLKHIKRRFSRVEEHLRTITARPLVYYEIDDSTGTPYTACKGSFIDQLISLAKARNVAHNVQPCPTSNPYPQISTEALIARNPQVILLGDANYGVTPDQVKARPGWNVISAVQNNKIYPIDDDIVSRAGPREIIGLETLAKLLHPEAFTSQPH
jgi:iron complex transport system substrate-binding protein